MRTSTFSGSGNGPAFGTNSKGHSHPKRGSRAITKSPEGRSGPIRNMAEARAGQVAKAVDWNSLSLGSSLRRQARWQDWGGLLAKESYRVAAGRTASRARFERLARCRTGSNV